MLEKVMTHTKWMSDKKDQRGGHFNVFILHKTRRLISWLYSLGGLKEHCIDIKAVSVIEPKESSFICVHRINENWH